VLPVRVAYVFNMSRGGGVDEAEFDTPETVDFVAGRLEELGHEVTHVDAGLPVGEFAQALLAAVPELVFNTAEGRTGRFREAFFPALYDELALAYTGSGAWTCAVTLDKRLTKLVAAAAGLQTPPARLVRAPVDLDYLPLRAPVIVKPNFEGSSKGVGPASIAGDLATAREAAAAALERFPDGVLVEEFVSGRDVTVALLEPHGSLAAVEYEFADRDAVIYDYELKNLRSDDVAVRAPADLPSGLAARLATAADAVFAAVSVRDLGRADFRVGEDGSIWFLEVNPLPSLEEGAGLYAAAELIGLGPAGVIGAVVESAVRRRATGVPA
jgi:D-alanine-D-alanine ligase